MTIAAGGMSDWGPEYWLMFISGLIGLALGTWAKIDGMLTKRKLVETDKTAARAEKAADISSQRITNVAQAQNSLRSDLTHVAAQMPPPQPWYPPSTPTPAPPADDGGNPRG